MNLPGRATAPPTDAGSCGLRSEQAELQSCCLGHPALVPRRVERDLDVDVRHAGHRARPPLHLLGQRLRGGAAGGRERHADGHGAGLADLDAVDQPELVDVHRNLRIVDLAERLDDTLLDLSLIDGRHRYSVVTGSPWPWSAARRVCQGSVAHLIRIGNSRTPSKTASRPGRAEASAAGRSSVSIALNCSMAAAASPTVFPLSAAVIIEAEALEMAQPDPWKPMSRSVSPSTSSSTEMRSPQSGLWPSAAAVGAPSRRKFRGLRLWSRMTSW